MRPTVIAIATAATLLLTGCGGAATTPTTSTATASTGASAVTATAVVDASADDAVPVGTPLRVGDPSNGVEVTVLRYVAKATTADPAWTGEGAVFGVRKGERLVAVQVRLVNIGSSGVFGEDAPPDVALTDMTGRQVMVTQGGPGTVTLGRTLGGVRLRPGQVVTGWVSQIIPDIDIAYVQYRLAEQTLEWRVAP
jgi:hypothetical protein